MVSELAQRKPTPKTEPEDTELSRHLGDYPVPPLSPKKTEPTPSEHKSLPSGIISYDFADDPPISDLADRIGIFGPASYNVPDYTIDFEHASESHHLPRSGTIVNLAKT